MARERGATVSAPAGTISAVVLGTFVVPYEVGVLPGWAADTTVLQADKLATQFTVGLTVPAPAGGSSFDWGVLDSG